MLLYDGQQNLSFHLKKEIIFLGLAVWKKSLKTWVACNGCDDVYLNQHRAYSSISEARGSTYYLMGHCL